MKHIILRWVSNKPDLSRSILLFFIILTWVSTLLLTKPVEAQNCQELRAQYQCPNDEVKYPIHLSFDDGPADVTPLILDVLKKEKIPATFIITASRLECKTHRDGCKNLEGMEQLASCQSFIHCRERLATTKRILKEGHIIGSHSYDHVRHTTIPHDEMQDYIARSKTILKPLLNTTPPLFRLPYGDGFFNQAKKPEVMKAVEAHGFKHLGWEMSAYDWKKSDQKDDRILQTVMKEICTKKRGVILFHDGVHDQEHIGRTFTAENLGKWIPVMRCVAEFKPLDYFIRDLSMVQP